MAATKWSHSRKRPATIENSQWSNKMARKKTCEGRCAKLLRGRDFPSIFARFRIFTTPCRGGDFPRNRPKWGRQPHRMPIRNETGEKLRHFKRKTRILKRESRFWERNRPKMPRPNSNLDSFRNRLGFRRFFCEISAAPKQLSNTVFHKQIQAFFCVCEGGYVRPSNYHIFWGATNSWFPPQIAIPRPKRRLSKSTSTLSGF